MGDSQDTSHDNKEATVSNDTSIQDQVEQLNSELNESTQAQTDGKPDEGDKPKGKKVARERPSARSALVKAAIYASTTKDQRRLLKNTKSPVVVVVRVPTVSWVQPVDSYFRFDLASRWSIFARDGSKRSRDKLDEGNGEVISAITLGESAMGIAPNIDILPSSLVASADTVVHIQPPNGAIVADAIWRFTGRRLRVPVSNDIVAGLDFFDIVAAFRPNSKPAEIAARLQAASNGRRGSSSNAENVPDLKTAVEYGAARDWGLALAQDIKDYRAGLIPWSAIDRGVVLFSDPGLGKSLFARILAKECKLPLVASSVAELFATSSGYLDGYIKAMRDLFAHASALAPAILFLDELDALPSRAKLSGRNSDWWLPVITEWLMLLDAAVDNQREGLIVVGATNYIENIDPALLRPGRLERSIHVERPNLEGTVNILRFHVRDCDFSENELLEIGRLIEGYTGAETMMFVRDARRIARREKRELRINDLREVALPADDERDDTILHRNSIHEAGHAVVAIVLHVGNLKKVTVIATEEGYGGQTQVEFGKTTGLTRKSIEDHVTMILSGRAAELVVLGEMSVGSGGTAHSDLAKATRLITGIHISVGLGESLVYRGPIAEAHEALTYDPLLRTQIEDHLQELQKRAIDLVEKHRVAIERVAEALREKRYLTGDAVREIFGGIQAGNDTAKTQETAET